MLALKKLIMAVFGDKNFAMECCYKLIELHAWPTGKINFEGGAILVLIRIQESK